MSISVANQGASNSITGTKLYVPVVTLSTEDNAKRHFLPTVKIKDYNASLIDDRHDSLIHGKNLFDQPVKINLRTLW